MNAFFEDSYVVCTQAEIMLAFIKALPLHIVTSAKKPIFTVYWISGNTHFSAESSQKSLPTRDKKKKTLTLFG